MAVKSKFAIRHRGVNVDLNASFLKFSPRGVHFFQFSPRGVHFFNFHLGEGVFFPKFSPRGGVFSEIFASGGDFSSIFTSGGAFFPKFSPRGSVFYQNFPKKLKIFQILLIKSRSPPSWRQRQPKPKFFEKKSDFFPVGGPFFFYLPGEGGCIF